MFNFTTLFLQIVLRFQQSLTQGMCLSQAKSQNKLAIRLQVTVSEIVEEEIFVWPVTQYLLDFYQC